MTDRAFAAPQTEEEAALRILIGTLFEFGDILFEPDGPNGPSLVVNNESGTEISLTESQSDILRAAGVPAFKEGERMKESEDVKQRIDEAEKELRDLFEDLIYEHCDNAGQYELNNLASGFNTLLKYAREWQKYGTR